MGSLRKQATKLAPKGLFLLLIGPSKAGKSHLMGTMPGKGNTLLLHGQGEKHGVKSAAKGANDKLIPVQWPA
ncbi:MAG: hypothetical protein EBX27_04775, partial [Proteobacteria bacterium]|nr:hypothetical protein [Pseudomonadota bacterium]